MNDLCMRMQPNYVGGSSVYWETCDKSQQNLSLVSFCLGSFFRNHLGLSAKRFLGHIFVTAPVILVVSLHGAYQVEEGDCI